MSENVISARGLGKRYTITHGKRHDTLLKTLTSFLRPAPPPAPTPGNTRMQGDAFWALSDIDFDIAQGDMVGIVGRNGAGKSTLLKILSNVTAPTTGEVTVQGRVGSLLEVGTGFNPDLSGRENIFLSAAILGMKRHEIIQRLDEIIAFAEIPGFVDTPVKHYSSGMYMRLAFAVAAHLDHEILLVDEVLAVGDAAFQRKCQQKIGDEAQSGRTILFVSHSLPAIAAICNRAIFLEQGKLIRDASVDAVLSEYQRTLSSSLSGFGTFDLADVQHFGTGKARFAEISLTPLDRDGNPSDILITGHDLRIGLKIEASQAVEHLNAAIVVYDATGYRLIDANLLLAGRPLDLALNQSAHVNFALRDLRLKPGEYSIGLWLGRTNVEDIDGVLHAVSFQVEPDLTTTQHTAIFPGVYQCRFDAWIDR